MPRLAFLLDVDNTLIDNDRVKQHLESELVRLLGRDKAAGFWLMYEEVRHELDYVDLPRVLQRFRRTFPDATAYPKVAALILCYPFKDSLFPGALRVISHLKKMGAVAILSDGDQVFQPAKISRSGLLDAVDGRAMIYIHKELHLDDVRRKVPAERHVLIDDKPKILAAAKAKLGGNLVTVHVHQGKYAGSHEEGPHADLEVDKIEDVLQLTEAAFLDINV